MSNVTVRLKIRSNIRRVFDKILTNSESYLIIHYSCESFYDIQDGRTPRITAIAVRYFNNAQTHTFSIHKIAELNRVKIDNIEKHYDKLEKKMLKEYFDFVKQHINSYWVHWNMRDINYGFEAIENRYRVLGGKPIKITDNNKIDFARSLVSFYGSLYVEHPRLEKIMELNNITNKDFLCGKDEATAFSNKEYVKLQQSTLRKVDAISSIIEKTISNTLKTKSKLHQIYGISPQGIYVLIKDYWLFNLIVFILGLALGFIMNKIFK